MARQFSEKVILVLASVADGDRHGYAISKDVARRTGGGVRLGSATLYRLLGQLLEDGLVEESDRRPAPELDDERRRYYRITPTGRRALAAELRRLDRVLAAARLGRRSASQRA
ncbi:MAG: PadR family transcriptional regulator [Luteitalea sp.]|nr:PadR family transcriptional regulator [Luteitalea sp.]